MRQKIGVVVSDHMSKTIVVKVERFKAHPKYHKKYRISTKFYAHDEQEEAGMGDTVTIQETRPLSKLKRWALVSIDSKGSRLAAIKEDKV